MRFTLEVIVNGETKAEEAADVDTSFSTATAFAGNGSGQDVIASSYAYDEMRVVRDGANLLGNEGFEAPILPRGTQLTYDNWRLYDFSRTDVGRVGSPVFAGSWAARARMSSGRGGGYVFQDVDLETGELFDFDARVFPEYGEQHSIRLMFDWDRGDQGTTSGNVQARFFADRMEYEAWGISGVIADPLPYGEWSRVVLRLETARSGWRIGQVGI